MKFYAKDNRTILDKDSDIMKHMHSLQLYHSIMCPQIILSTSQNIWFHPYSGPPLQFDYHCHHGIVNNNNPSSGLIKHYCQSCLHLWIKTSPSSKHTNITYISLHQKENKISVLQKYIHNRKKKYFI